VPLGNTTRSSAAVGGGEEDGTYCFNFPKSILTLTRSGSLHNMLLRPIFITEVKAGSRRTDENIFPNSERRILKEQFMIQLRKMVYGDEHIIISFINYMGCFENTQHNFKNEFIICS
jgi:hypothetical protein